jgi:hypothetical protein
MKRIMTKMRSVLRVVCNEKWLEKAMPLEGRAGAEPALLFSGHTFAGDDGHWLAAKPDERTPMTP